MCEDNFFFSTWCNWEVQGREVASEELRASRWKRPEEVGCMGCRLGKSPGEAPVGALGSTRGKLEPGARMQWLREGLPLGGSLALGLERKGFPDCCCLGVSLSHLMQALVGEPGSLPYLRGGLQERHVDGGKGHKEYSGGARDQLPNLEATGLARQGLESVH